MKILTTVTSVLILCSTAYSDASIPCETQGKRYEIEGEGGSGFQIDKSDHTQVPWQQKLDEAEANCEADIQTQTLANALDCVVFCSQWICDTRYTTDQFECTATNEDVTIQSSGSDTSWIYIFTARGKTSAECRCITKPKPE